MDRLSRFSLSISVCLSASPPSLCLSESREKLHPFSVSRVFPPSDSYFNITGQRIGNRCVAYYHRETRSYRYAERYEAFEKERRRRKKEREKRKKENKRVQTTSETRIKWIEVYWLPDGNVALPVERFRIELFKGGINLDTPVYEIWF